MHASCALLQRPARLSCRPFQTGACRQHGLSLPRLQRPSLAAPRAAGSPEDASTDATSSPAPQPRMFSSFTTEEQWRELDKEVNKYPGQRVFTAIGSGGDDFKKTMLKAVEDVVGKVHVECVRETPSSGGKYLSVRVGPVWVTSADQVVQVFNNMREDERLKWYM